MFTKFHIRNFRTHVDTEISLRDMTLIIGGNNSGKTNLLEALRFFSGLVGRSFAENKEDSKVIDNDYTENIHSLNNFQDIMFKCEWRGRYNPKSKIDYTLIIKWDFFISVSEELTFTDSNNKPIVFIFGSRDNNQLLLRNTIEVEKNHTITTFFQELASLKYYNFQPFLLKQEAIKYPKKINIAQEIDSNGANFQSIIKYIKENEDEIYNKFVGFLRRFEESFVGIKIEKEQVKWQFDMGNSQFPAFEPQKVSEGLLKAGAIALLCAIANPPKIIMIEEVENGINQKNLAEFLKWLINTSENGENTQFILTSHSPSVIREFADRIDTVYNVHLKKKKGYVSEVINLNEALKPLVRFGAIKEESVFEENGLVRIRPHALTELFYNGILGEL